MDMNTQTIQPGAALEEAPARFSFARLLLGWLSRSLALGLGGFALFNLLMVESGSGSLDGNLWWINLSYWPEVIRNALLVFFSVFALAYAFRPQMSLLRQLTWMLLLALVILTVASNALDYLMLLERGTLADGRWMSFSFIVLVLLMIIVAGSWLGIAPTGKKRWFTVPMMIMTLLVMALSFPWLQVETLGRTDYRREADVALVYGARAYPSGRCSTTLHDRVMTAVALYHEGRVDQILMSGGPVNETMHETEAMRRLAVKHGVPNEDILIDEEGLNTRASTRNTIERYQLLNRRMRKGDRSRVLVVSNFYHIPRIRMTFAQEGVQVHSIPAKQKFVYGYTPWMMMRETAAFWVYYVEGMLK